MTCVAPPAPPSAVDVRSVKEVLPWVQCVTVPSGALCTGDCPSSWVVTTVALLVVQVSFHAAQPGIDSQVPT